MSTHAAYWGTFASSDALQDVAARPGDTAFAVDKFYVCTDVVPAPVGGGEDNQRRAAVLGRLGRTRTVWTPFTHVDS